jgi:pimeloyl-ACP methyl ester carboxylesterase
MEEKVFFDGELGKVCGVLHKTGKSKEVVIVVHGFSSSKNTGAKDISKILESNGLDALRIDLDNMGESELDFETGASVANYVKQIEASIKYCKSLGYEEISLIGTSYGGTSVFATALKHSEIKRIVMRAPVVDYKEHALRKYGEEKLKELKEQGFIPYEKNGKHYKRNFASVKDSYQYSMFEHAQKVKCPVLIIKGDADTDVEADLSKKIIPYFKDAKIHIIKGAGHQLDVNGDFSESQKALIDFFKD